MTQDELNQYIEHYIDKDRTLSAIMLTGNWGSGKSYYIKKSLIPYLIEKEKDCVVISLYGINDLNDISKAIYMELRSINIFKSKYNETFEVSKILGKTVLKNVIQLVPMLNIDTDVKEEDMIKLYKSINLSGKLIIFEDIERSTIDIINFLGYVNNLVEQDGIKVLLVANEKEIVNKDKYKQVKEKTINDTINFNCDYKDAIRNIISLFKDEPKNLDGYLNDIEEISGILESGNGNLRSFLFACQKTIDILNKDIVFEGDVVKCIFFSIIYFSLQFKMGDNIHWDGTEECSTKLGNKKYPLFKPIYNYIINSYIDINKLREIDKYYINFNHIVYDVNLDEDIKSLYSYYLKDEKVLKNVIANIDIKLKKNIIPIEEYGKLAMHLVKVSEILELDISKSKNLIINNVKTLPSDFYSESIFDYERLVNEIPLSDQYKKLKDEMMLSINSNKKSEWEQFIYEPSEIINFSNKILKNNLKEVLRNTLSINLDQDKLIGMLSQCSANEINKLRGIFWSIYRKNGSILYTEENNQFLNELYSKVGELREKSGLDKIVKHQLSMFMDNLKIFTGENEYIE